MMVIIDDDDDDGPQLCSYTIQKLDPIGDAEGA